MILIEFFLKTYHLNESEIEMEDPFQIYISRFLSRLNSGRILEEDKFAEGAANLRMMSQIYFGDL